jgi:hypothetical protein
MYINELSQLKISQLNEFFENIFSFKAWSKEHEKEIEQATNYIQKMIQKEINDGITAFKKNYKDEYKFIEFHRIPFLLIADTEEKFKNFFKKLSEIDKFFENFLKFGVYSFLKNFGPSTIVLDVTEKDAAKKFNANKPEKIYNIPFIFIPERNFFEKVLLKGDLLGFFTKPSWYRLEKAIATYHEAVEFNRYAHKDFHLGFFYVKHKKDFYLYGNHFSIMVLLKEAVVLNKFKQLDAIKVLRDFRKKYEWRIIKAKTGIDFSTITKITPDIVKKLQKVKPETFGDVQGLFIDSKDLEKFKTASKTTSKTIQNLDIFQKINMVNFW